MKVLFMCKYNVGRSQMAKAFFQKFSDEKHLRFEAVSAGTHVSHDREGIKLSAYETVNNVLTSMDEEDIDVRDNASNQITPEAIADADKVVIMTEKENWPKYIEDNRDKIIIWVVDDAKDKDLVFHRKMRDQIKKLVNDFVNSLSEN